MGFQRGHIENIRFVMVFGRGTAGIQLEIQAPPSASQGLAHAATVKYIHFHKVFKGFSRNRKIFQETVRYAMCGDLQKNY